MVEYTGQQLFRGYPVEREQWTQSVGLSGQ